MPIYEYQCKPCDRVVEVLIRSPDDQAECPDCGNRQLEQLLSVAAAPSIAGRSPLPVTGGGESCAAPRCCGGGCQLP